MTNLPLLLLLLCLACSTPRARASLVALESYRSLLRVHPLATNAATASVISVVSDSISQSIERRQASRAVGAKAPTTNTSRPPPPPSPSSPSFSSHRLQHDYLRSLSMAAYGAAVFGVFVTWWFSVLSRWVPVTDFRSVVVKVLVNQVS